MGFRKKGLSCAEAKERDIVEYLSGLDIEPTRIKGNDYWYLSPLRTEKTASFKVNRKLNRWYDHSMGHGGNIIDFAVRYHDFTVGEFLRSLEADLSFQTPRHISAKEQVLPEPGIMVQQQYPMVSTDLLNYLHERRISQRVADHYCKEVQYLFEAKRYYAIGFKNIAGGYELRNRYFKGSSTPKDISIIKNGAKALLLFEGFFDFLSYLTMMQKVTVTEQDFLILNSLSFFEKALPVMREYDYCRLFLDNDTAGQNCSRYACSLDGRFKNESSLYRNYKDLNDLLTGNTKR